VLVVAKLLLLPPLHQTFKNAAHSAPPCPSATANSAARGAIIDESSQGALQAKEQEVMESA